MTLVRRSSPLGELVWQRQAMDLQIPKAEAVKPRQIRITPTTHEATNGTNGMQGLAAGETTTETARASA